DERPLLLWSSYASASGGGPPFRFIRLRATGISHGIYDYNGMYSSPLYGVLEWINAADSFSDGVHRSIL
ncbi:hypothetical protein QSI34_28815, partial [Escherichia coli]|uniref:hypothetical protein n=1 Tax=Escherichia coli TaxID=562 RepID=UPI00287AA742